jgi:hypothetical protein
MNVGSLLACLHRLEHELAHRYLTLGDQHAADHDVYHQCRTFALQSEAHAERIAVHAANLGPGAADVECDSNFWTGPRETAREETPDMVGSSRQGGLLLLRDLRRLFLAAEEVSITWVMADQAAQALRDQALLDTVRDCHPETELQVSWLTTRIKVASPQALVTG